MPNTDKIHIDVFLVRRLIATQFPEWAALPIKPVEEGGWDNRTFRLGDYMVIRLPSAACYSSKVEKEQLWLPKLAPFLPLQIPIPVARGKSGEGYPWPWSIYQWLEGHASSRERIGDMNAFARALARFLIALQKIDASQGPLAGPHNFYRGGSLRIYDAETRQAMAILRNEIDIEVATALWDAALASSWHNTPVWVHGDIAASNLLVQNGQLSAVIDFGGLGVGDPACDLVIAWTLFEGESRVAFCSPFSFDNATWVRARGWALWKALIVCARLCSANAADVEKSWNVIKEVLTGHRHGG